MRRKIWFFLWLAQLVTVYSVQASNPPGHLYAALQARAAASETVQTLLTNHAQSYLMGSVAPDIGVLLAMGSETAPGAEAHYRHTGEMVLALLREADSLPDANARAAAQAFALGWLTHYVVDNHIHGLVNQFGGYFGAGGAFVDRHHLLELYENEYVFAEHGQAGLPDTLNPAAVNQAVLRAAWQKTFYPGRTLPAEFDRGPRVDLPLLGPTHSGQGLAQMTVNLAEAYSAMVQTHKQDNPALGGIYAAALGGWQPSPTQYRAIKEPLKVESVGLLPPDPQSSEKMPRLKITYAVNDLRLYSVFGKAWETTMKAAIQQATTYLNSWGAAPAALALPNTNMDTGGLEGSTFDTAQAFPGNPDLREMVVRVRVEDRKRQTVACFEPDGTTVRPAGGSWEPILTADPGQALPGLREVIGQPVAQVWGEMPGAQPAARAGRAFFTVPFQPGEGPPYTVHVSLSLQDKAQGKPYGVEADWDGTLGKVELSILFLVDCSGSMAGEKLEAAKAAVREAVNDSDDGKTEWALVSYGACEVAVICPFTMDAASLRQATAELDAGGDTPLTYARNLALAYLVTKGHAPRGRLILLCDGQDNCAEHGSATASEAEESLRPLLPPQRIDVTTAAGGAGGGAP